MALMMAEVSTLCRPAASQSPGMTQSPQVLYIPLHHVPTQKMNVYVLENPGDKDCRHQPAFVIEQYSSDGAQGYKIIAGGCLPKFGPINRDSNIAANTGLAKWTPRHQSPTPVKLLLPPWGEVKLQPFHGSFNAGTPNSPVHLESDVEVYSHDGVLYGWFPASPFTPGTLELRRLSKPAPKTDPTSIKVGSIEHQDVERTGAGYVLNNTTITLDPSVNPVFAIAAALNTLTRVSK